MVAEPEVGGKRPVRMDLRGEEAAQGGGQTEAPSPASPCRLRGGACRTHMVVVLPAPLWPRKETTWFS